MLCVQIAVFPEQESVSLGTSKMTAILATPESGLVPEGIMMTPTPVEMKLHGHQIMALNTSKLLVTY